MHFFIQLQFHVFFWHWYPTVYECFPLRHFITGISQPTFKTSRLVQFLGAFIACSSGQRGPLWWAAHHRRHHRHSDTEKDVHSPHSKSFFWSHTLWFMTDYAVPTFLKEIPDLLKFRELRFLNRFDWIPLVLLGFFCYYLPEFAWFTSLTKLTHMQSLIWGFFVPTIILYHATFAVNSITHLFGSDGSTQRMKAEIVGYGYLRVWRRMA